MVTILRIGHRPERDKRITSHLALVARAFGAVKLVIAGNNDPHLEQTVVKVVTEWGGDFKINLIPIEDWKTFILEWKSGGGKIVHLTMYGQRLQDFEELTVFKKFQKGSVSQKLLVVVGGEKVPGKIFKYADWNVAIGNQPHSEISSLAVFLNHLMPHALQKDYQNAQKKIIPSLKGIKSYAEPKDGKKS